MKWWRWDHPRIHLHIIILCAALVVVGHAAFVVLNG